MSSAQQALSDRGERLLPSLIDEISVQDPNRVFASYPLGPRPKDGYRDVIYKELAAAINYSSWWIEKCLGRSTDFTTLTYYGSRDLRSTILMYAAIKTGHKLFLSACALGIHAIVDDDLRLLEDLQCNIMLLSAENYSPVVAAILSKRNIRTMTTPSLEDLLQIEAPVYPFNKNFQEAKHEPFVALHTSGTTGRPKCVVLNHGTVAHHDLFLEAHSLGGKGLNQARLSGKRVLIGLPYFHGAAIFFFAFAVYSSTIPVLLPGLPSSELVNEALISTHVDAGFLTPSTLSDMVRYPEYSENLKRLQYLTFAGAPLLPEVGNKLKDITHLFTSFGTTECGAYALEETAPDDWQYLSFSPIMGAELRPLSENLFELFFVRSNDPRKSQGIFSTFPNLQEYSLKDLFSKHPSKEGLWLHEGRTDDVIKFRNLQRHSTCETERILDGHPAIQSTIVCGTDRARAALLIEARSPPTTSQETSALLEEIRPSVELANERVESKQGQILRELIVFTSEARPMVRASKGSILRKKTVDMYQADLDEVFDEHAKAVSSGK